MTEVQFNALIHAPLRLEICAFLNPLEEVEFKVLRSALDVSDSVLSKHISRLEAAGLVDLNKKKWQGRQRTWIRLTPLGRKAFAGHVQALRTILAKAEKGGQPESQALS